MERNKYAPLALAIVSIALYGCSSSSDSDDDAFESSLTDEQQAVVATQGLTGFGDQADSFAEQGEQQGGGGSTSSQSGTMTTASTQTIDCDSGGPMVMDEEPSFQGSDIPFPEGITGHPAGSSDDGYAMSADDCTMSAGGQSMTMDGQVEIAEFGDFDGGNGTIYLRFGGFSGDTFADIGSPFTSGDEMSSQGHMALCYSCVNADPGNMSGQVEDSAFVAHFSSEMESYRLELGENVPDGTPLSVISREDTDGALIDVNGRHAFKDEDCAIDVTMETVTEIQVNNWGPTVADPSIQSGEMNVTTNASGETYNVEWSNGTQFINGEEVTDELLAEIEGCG